MGGRSGTCKVGHLVFPFEDVWKCLQPHGNRDVWMSDEPPAQTLLALPAPKDDAAPGTITLNVSTGEPVVMDHLGPVVVNVDGTLSRIANWDEMIDHEKELTKRRIAKRNIERLKALAESGELTGEQMSALANPREE